MYPAVAGAAPQLIPLALPCRLFRLPCTAVCHRHRKHPGAPRHLLISQRQLNLCPDSDSLVGCPVELIRIPPRCPTFGGSSAHGRCQHLIVAGEGEIIAAGGDGRIIPRRPGIKKGHSLCCWVMLGTGRTFAAHQPATDAPDKPAGLTLYPANRPVPCGGRAGQVLRRPLPKCCQSCLVSIRPTNRGAPD